MDCQSTTTIQQFSAQIGFIILKKWPNLLKQENSLKPIQRKYPAVTEILIIKHLIFLFFASFGVIIFTYFSGQQMQKLKQEKVVGAAKVTGCGKAKKQCFPNDTNS